MEPSLQMWNIQNTLASTLQAIYLGIITLGLFLGKLATSTFLFKQQHQRLPIPGCYMVLIRPVMDYVCTFWDPVTQTNIIKVELARRRAIGTVMWDFRIIKSVTKIMETLGWPSLEERIKKDHSHHVLPHFNKLIDVEPRCLALRGGGSKTRGQSQKYAIPLSKLQSGATLLSIGYSPVGPFARSCRFRILKFSRRVSNSCELCSAS